MGFRLLHNIPLIKLSPILLETLSLAVDGVDAFQMIFTLKDVSLVTGLWSASLHAGLLAAGETDLVVIVEVVTTLGRTGGYTGLVAGSRLALQGWNSKLDSQYEEERSLLTADAGSPPRCWYPGLQTSLGVGTDGSAETLTVSAHVTAAGIVNTLVGGRVSQFSSSYPALYHTTSTIQALRCSERA